MKLPPRTDRIADVIYDLHEHRAKDWRRPHLGASVVGDEECLRKLWYLFRWARAHSPAMFEPVGKIGRRGQLLRLFERGEIEERRFADELRALGWTVVGAAPDRQERVSFHGGHFSGSADGRVLGVAGAEKTWHLLECKTSNARRFEDLQRNGVRAAQSGHYAQCQVYMLGLRLTRALYLCACKNDDRIYSERIRFDRAFAEGVVRRARDVVLADRPPVRVSEDPTWFECKMCHYRPICHLGHVWDLERSCRTCVSATPGEDGAWRCEHHGALLDVDAQKRGCDAHRMIPDLLPWEVTGARDDAEGRWIDYRDPTGAVIRDLGHFQWKEKT